MPCALRPANGLADCARLTLDITYLQFQLGDLTLEVLGEDIGTRRLPFEYLVKGDLCAHLEFILAF
jgi:hypothetical protein